jgi:hypothetical protein
MKYLPILLLTLSGCACSSPLPDLIDMQRRLKWCSENQAMIDENRVHCRTLLTDDTACMARQDANQRQLDRLCIPKEK